MIESNDIDIFLKREDLLNIFDELIVQINDNTEFFKIKFNIIDNISKNNLNPITILDTISIKEIIDKKLILNNYIFIVDDVEKIAIEYLNDNYINYACVDTPISFLALQEKCKNLIIQINNSISERISFKNFSYSFKLNTVYTDKNSLYLTDKENEIFQVLIENSNNSLNKKQLLSKIWNYSEDIDTHTLETHIYTLRKKIKKKLNLSNFITHGKSGYRINDQVVSLFIKH